MQVGKVYENRGLYILTCTEKCEGTYPYRVESTCGTMFYNVDENGHYVEPNYPSERDIMKQITLPDPVDEFMEWAADKEFVTQSGQVVKLSSIYKGIEFDWACLPAWANWIAMDKDGGWKWFREKPAISEDYEIWNQMVDNAYYSGFIPNEYFPSNITGSWKDNLHKRPTQTHN